MALTFTERFRADMGGKAVRCFEITHDGSTTAIPASSLDLNYVDFALAGPGTIVLSASSTKATDLTTTYGTALAMTALSSGCTTHLLAIGW